MIKSFERYFTLFSYSASFFITILLFQALIFALLNIFILPLILFSLIVSFILTIIFLFYLRRNVSAIPHLSLYALILIALVSIILIKFPHDTFGGRDEALFANLAVYLAEHGSTKLPSYLSNLPSSLAEGAEARLPAYTVWLAIQKMLFGEKWLLSSNTILIGFGLCSLFLVSSFLGGKKVGLFTIVLYSTSMPFLWFSRETLTENLAFFLFWVLILLLITFPKAKNYTHLIYAYIVSWLLGLTRIEGFFIQFTVLITLLMLPLFSMIRTNKKGFLVLGVFFAFIVSNWGVVKSLSGSYLGESITSVKKGIELELKYSLPRIIQESLSEKQVLPKLKGGENLYDNLPYFYAQMLGKYNFIVVIFFIFYLFFSFVIKKKTGSDNKKQYILLLFIVILPELYKIINPSVTLDQPWFYRRYVYALLPTGYIGLSMFLNRLPNRKIMLFLFFSFLVINISLSNQIVFLKNNWLLIDKIKDVTKDVTKNDYVIVRNTALVRYRPTTFLILQRGIRSSVFTEKLSEFSPEKKVINGAPYNKLYLISDNENENYPNFKALKKNAVELNYSQLIPSCDLSLLGEYFRLYNVYDYARIPYSEAISYCNLAGNEIKKYKYHLYLHELIYEK